MEEKALPKVFLLAFLLAVAVSFFSSAVFVSNSFAYESKDTTPPLHVNGEEVFFQEQKPYIDSNYKTFVPIRPLGNILNAEVNWIQNDKEENFIRILRKNVELILEVENNRLLRNGEPLNFEGKLKTNGEGRTFAPLRSMVEALGGTITWSKEEEAVNIIDSEVEKINDKFTTPPKTEKVLTIISEYKPIERKTVEKLITRSKEIDVDISLILGLLRVESVFDPNNISDSGALGLFQVMPSTAKTVANNYGIEYERNKLFDPQYNIKIGTIYLRDLFEQYDYDVHKALTAYNKGPIGLNNYIRNNGTAASTFSNMVLDKSKKYEEKLK